jgi:hypothetical protein
MLCDGVASNLEEHDCLRDKFGGRLEGIGRFRITPDGLSYVYSYERTLSDLYLVDGFR